MESDPRFAKADASADEHFERWEFERLAEFARGGSLAAGRELIRRAAIRLESACSERPDLIPPDLGNWLRKLLDEASKNPRQPVGHLIAPRSSISKRPKSHAELLHDLSLMQEAYFRVRKAVEAGEPLKNVFDAVAEELNVLGYRNSNNKPLKGSSIRDRYYAVSRKMAPFGPGYASAIRLRRKR
jgi:hypothetical protein